MSPILKQRLAAVPQLVWLLLLTLACLVPFANKAFHIDDTLFLRAAQQIQQHPADFYGCTMNWFGTPQPMVQVFDNPPLTCYYIALVAAVTGWSEVALHLAFLLPALAAVWGTFSLARQYCKRPVVAALVAILTPVFLISATTLMCDVMLLAFWVWALVWFEKGLQKNDWSAFLASGLLAGLAVWTKFTALALVPLLAAYGLTRQRRPGWWLIALVIPLLFTGGYEWVTHRLYGRGLLSGAAAYASETAKVFGVSLLGKETLGLIFLGGCFLPVLLYLPSLWSRRSILIGLVLLVCCALLLPSLAQLKPFLRRADGTLNWASLLQSALFTVAGIHLLLLVGADFWHLRDPTSLLLVLWVLGIFVFATALNWTINGRSLLPIVPAIGILVARRLDRQQPSTAPSGFWRTFWPALPAGILSLLLVTSDYNLANTSRTAAAQLYARHHKPGNALWFEGHWGFQYYMEALGASAIDVNGASLVAGDIVVLPSNATNIRELPSELIRPVEVMEYLPNSHYTIMNSSAGAGFYAAAFGPLPFAAGDIKPVRFRVYEFK
jgi:hypothetical protein